MRGLSQMGRIGPTHEWGWMWSSVDGVQPASAMGDAITPTQNTTGGAYVELASTSEVAFDVWEIDVCINTIGITTAARDALGTLAVDPAGGTAWVDIYDLCCGQAANYAARDGGGVHFRLPLFIKAGSSVGMRGSVNSATLTAFNAFVKLRGRPANPELVRAGRYTEQFGVTAASSTGTSVTSGGASEGAWTEIGTVTRPLWAFEFGFGCNDSAVSNNIVHVDLAVGDASSKKIILLDHPVLTSQVEGVFKPAAPILARAAAGAKVYARYQSGAAAADTVSCAIYGIGG